MNGVNKVILVGFIGKDFEAKQTSNNSSYAYGSVGVQESWRDKQTNEMKSKTTWVDVLFSGKIAESASKLLKKGTQVYIEGKLQTRTKEVNGQMQSKTEIVVNAVANGSFQILQWAKKPESSQPAQAPTVPDYVNEAPPITESEISGMELEMEDDIPF